MNKQEKNTEILIAEILDGIQKVKGQDITILDLREIENAVCQYFIICTGNSSTQVVALSGSVQRTTKHKPWHTEGEQNAKWILMDYIDVVVHIFDKDTRNYYNIEGLWGDAKITKIQEN